MIINKKMQRMNLNKFLLVSNIYNSKKNFRKIDHIKGIINELSYALGEDTIDNIMKTHKDYEYGVKFLKFLDLHGKLKSKEITKELNISNPRLVEFWYRRFPPRPIRTLLTIYFNNYHKISKIDLAYLFGWGFGDGGLSSDLGYYFICGKKDDLLIIKEHISVNIQKTPIIIKNNDGYSTIILHNGKKKIIRGKSWILYIRDSSFCKLLYSYGLPKGNKVLQKIEIPSWIKNGGKGIRKAFLNGLFEGELQKHKVQFNFKRNKIDICPITFGMNKVENHEENLIEFLNEIKNLLNQFDIKTTKVESCKPGIIRKDNKKTYSTRFYISISAINTVNFSKVIHYPFNKEKREALIEAVNEARIKLKRMSIQVDKYKKAVELFNDGLSVVNIARELEVTYSTVRHWLKTEEHLPILLNRD